MSRGLGRVQREALEYLQKVGPLRSDRLALYVGASEDSTRRALRKLHRSKRVVFLGFAGRGVRVWCLPEQEEEARAYMVSPDRLAYVGEVMGQRFARSLARSVLSIM